MASEPEGFRLMTITPSLPYRPERDAPVAARVTFGVENTI